MQDSEPSSACCEPASESNGNESWLQPTRQGRSVDYRKNDELDEDFFLYRRKQPMKLKGEGNKQEVLYSHVFNIYFAMYTSHLK
jgi:hypothetical protein